jgi:hypothetical protein
MLSDASTLTVDLSKMIFGDPSENKVLLICATG